jgi:hypothetical protein
MVVGDSDAVFRVKSSWSYASMVVCGKSAARSGISLRKSRETRGYCCAGVLALNRVRYAPGCENLVYLSCPSDEMHTSTSDPHAVHIETTKDDTSLI